MAIKIFAYELGAGDNIVHGFAPSLEDVTTALAIVRNEISRDEEIPKPPATIFSFDVSDLNAVQLCSSLNNDQWLGDIALTNKTLIQHVD